MSRTIGLAHRRGTKPDPHIRGRAGPLGARDRRAPAELGQPFRDDGDDRDRRVVRSACCGRRLERPPDPDPLVAPAFDGGDQPGARVEAERRDQRAWRRRASSMATGASSPALPDAERIAGPGAAPPDPSDPAGDGQGLATTTINRTPMIASQRPTGGRPPDRATGAKVPRGARPPSIAPGGQSSPR